MKKFIFYCLTIICSTLSVFLILDWLYTELFDDEAILAMPYGKQYDYLIIGDSRAGNTIDNDYLEKLTGSKVLNRGISGSALQDDFSVIHYFLERKNNCKTILYQVDPWQGGQNFASLNYMFIPNKPVLDSEIPVPFIRYMKYNTYYSFFNLIRNSTTEKHTPNKYKLLDFPYKRNYEFFQDHTNATFNTAHFKSVIEFCKSKNIELIFFTAPVSDDYIKIQSDYNYFRDELKKLDCKYLDFSHLFKGTEFFADDVHVNTKGAKKLTYELAKQLLH